MGPYFDVQRTQTQGVSTACPLRGREQEAEAAPTPALGSPVIHAAKVLKTGKQGQGPGHMLVTVPTPAPLAFPEQGARISSLM